MSKPARAHSVKPSSACAVYAYAIVESPRAPALAKLPAGVPGAGRPRAIELGGGLWLIAADAPLSLYGGEVIEANLRDLEWVGARAIGHEGVIEALAAKLPALPLKMFTLFSSEERAKSQLGADRARLRRAIARIRGSAEWGVRVSFDELAARRRAQSEARSESRGSSGTAFLLKKQKEQRLARELLGNAQAETDALFTALSKAAKQAKRRAPGPAEVGARILLEAAFLVPLKDRSRFEKAVAERRRALAPAGYAVALSGPWPVYNFVAESE